MKTILRELLTQTDFVVRQLSPEYYSALLPVLMGNSIGKHVRHILDLMECLVSANLTSELNYDERKREPEVEISPERALQKIRFLIEEIEKLDSNKKLKLKQKISRLDVVLETQMDREILYNIEHTVHHLAIIRIGIEHHFSQIEIPENFGIAYSTVQHKFSET